MGFEIHNLSSNSQQAITLQRKSKFGEFKSGKVVYTKFEALYLLEKKRASGKKIHLIKSEQPKYEVYKNLRDSGYVPKAALKYGADFRVYTKKRPHAEYLVFMAGKTIKSADISAKARIAHSTKKALLIALVDEEADVSFYEINWKRI